jgi:hypothetical protein
MAKQCPRGVTPDEKQVELLKLEPELKKKTMLRNIKKQYFYKTD